MLAEKGCKTIILGSRDLSRGEAAATQVRKLAKVPKTDDKINDENLNVEVLSLDPSEKDGVKQFLKEVNLRHDVIDIVISSAAEIQNKPRLNSRGIDEAFATNHLGLQQLLVGIKPSLAKNSRVVVVGSRLESKGKIDPQTIEKSKGQQLRPGGWKDPMKHHADAKLANQLLVTEFSRQWHGAGSSVDIVSVSPGMVHTKLWRHFPIWYQVSRSKRCISILHFLAFGVFLVTTTISDAFVSCFWVMQTARNTS